MKKIFILIAFAFLTFSSQAVTELQTKSTLDDVAEVQALPKEMQQLNVADFLAMTPEKYTAMTGEKLGVANTLKLKAAQKIVKNQFGHSAPIEKGVYILLAILGLAWIAMGLADNWSGNDWIINLVLTVLCWLPGVIHAFVKMKKYYPS